VKLVFTREAKRALDELRSYLEPLSPKGLAHVVQSIELRVSAALANLRIGRPTPREDLRELVESKYVFVIQYCLNGRMLFVLRVCHARRQPLGYDALTLP
jgi:plasmid stabilization system protein ParE